MKNIILIFSLLFLITGSVNAQFNKAGRTSMQFLKIGIGARQVAVGESGISSIQDINSIFWNPAAITAIADAQASFTYTNWIADINIYSGAVGYNLGSIGTIALSYISLDYGNIPEALVTSVGGGIDSRTGNTFSGSDISFGLGFAREFTDKLSIGANFKYIREDLFVYSTDLWAFDFGSFYNTGWKGIRLAMSAQNFSTPARWLETLEEEQQSHDIPLVYRIGASIDLLGGSDLLFGGDPTHQKLTFNIDAIHSNDYAERLHMGMEYWLFNMFSIRGGYKFNHKEGNLSLGAGINYNVGFVDIRFDYAYVDYDFLQSPHRFSILMSF